jgi:2-(1,2-epoxy-1,2-dihydrophenyl)acetyl-CoA isomerase
MADTVLYETADGLATITLNRPDAMNALNTETKVALRDAVQRAAADSGVRAVLITGNGRAFCVGQDLKEHVGSLAADRENPGSGGTWTTVREHYNPTITAITTMPKPVVAAVNGIAAGAGASLAFACDLRIVADTAAFNTSFAGVALTADSGASWTLPRLVGHAKAMELLLFPQTIPAAQAQALGLANRVVPAADLPQSALTLARELAEGPTVAYAAIKESVTYAASHTMIESLTKEDELQTRAGASEDHAIAVEAFLKKEKPIYRGK